MSEWPDFTESPCVRSGRQAFEKAGVTANDIDVCELYDSFTSTVLVTPRRAGVLHEGAKAASS